MQFSISNFLNSSAFPFHLLLVAWGIRWSCRSRCWWATLNSSRQGSILKIRIHSPPHPTATNKYWLLVFNFLSLVFLSSEYVQFSSAFPLDVYSSFLSQIHSFSPPLEHNVFVLTFIRCLSSWIYFLIGTAWYSKGAEISNITLAQGVCHQVGQRDRADLPPLPAGPARHLPQGDDGRVLHCGRLPG